MAFAAERLKEKRYAFSDQEIKPYFTRSGFSTACSASSRRCSKCASARRAPVWHPSVRFFRIERPAARGDAAPELIGQFYLDPHARAGKRPGAWMDGTRERWLRPAASCRRRWRTWCATSRRRWTAAPRC